MATKIYPLVKLDPKYSHLLKKLKALKLNGPLVVVSSFYVHDKLNELKSIAQTLSVDGIQLVKK